MPPAPFDIQFRNTCRSIRVPRAAFKSVCRKILRALGYRQADLGVALVGDAAMRRLNRAYLRHDRPTDVMAFNLRAHPRLASPRVFLGDVVISLPTARRQAALYGNSFSYELYFYLCHGILHLTGFDDAGPRQARRMEKRQAEILKRAGVTGSGVPRTRQRFS